MILFCYNLYERNGKRVERLGNKILRLLTKSLVYSYLIIEVIGDVLVRIANLS